MAVGARNMFNPTITVKDFLAHILGGVAPWKLQQENLKVMRVIANATIIHMIINQPSSSILKRPGIDKMGPWHKLRQLKYSSPQSQGTVGVSQQLQRLCHCQKLSDAASR